MLVTALVAAALGVPAHNVAVSISRDGPRPPFDVRISTKPAAGRLERRAHTRMRRRLESAGLDVRVQRFDTPRGRSRNVIGVRAGGRCLRVLMAHTDSMPQGPGAIDNASGVGLLAGLAPRLEEIDPPCSVWLVATTGYDAPARARSAGFDVCLLKPIDLETLLHAVGRGCAARE